MLQDTLMPIKGRPKEFSGPLVNQLGKQWFILTGRPPTRSYDAINDKESGPFYDFCHAAAATVAEIAPAGKLDAAIRQTCNDWRSNTQWVREVMDKNPNVEPRFQRLFVKK